MRKIWRKDTTMLKITKIQFILDERDAEVIKQLLNYGFHRSSVHKKHIHGAKFKEIQRLRKEFGIIGEESSHWQEIIHITSPSETTTATYTDGNYYQINPDGSVKI